MTLLPFDSSWDAAFGAEPPKPHPPDITGDGAVGTGPYGDGTEHVPWTIPPTAPIVYPEFHPTDARAVEIFLEPLHYNLILNPSLRTSAQGWSATPALTLDDDSWVGRSLRVTTAGQAQYEPIYVGPVQVGADDWYEPGMGGTEYTFSLFAKGTDAYLRLSLFGYPPSSYEDSIPTMAAEHIVEVHSPQVLVNTDDWERFYVKTTSRMADISGGTTDFAGCWWVVPRVEIIPYGSPDVLLSSFLVDPTEGPLCDYFDGDMAEGGVRDDYIWLKDLSGKPRFSAYYPQRVERCRWLYTHLYDAVPVNRPVHIYYHDRANAWDPEGPPPHELTGQLRTSHVDGPSMVEVAVSRYGDLASPLP